MWGRGSKQRRAAERRHRAYRRAWDVKMKTLAFGWLYSVPRTPAPPFVEEWLRKRNNLMLANRRRTGQAFADYAAIEMRLLADLAKAANYPIVVATQKHTITGRQYRSDAKRVDFAALYNRWR